MNNGSQILLTVSVAVLSMALTLPAAAPAGKRMVFGGGSVMSRQE